MKRTLILALVLMWHAAAPAGAQRTSDQARRNTRESLRALLAKEGSRTDVNTTFRQSSGNEWNLTGVMKAGLKHVDSLEIVFSVTDDDTIGLRVFPYYQGAYINIDKVKDPAGLMRQLLVFTGRNFLFWGIDKSGDVFCGYTITLESGFPYEATVMVLRSIIGTDGFVGDMRQAIDGSRPAAAAGWTSYTSPEGRYSALFPSAPRLSSQQATAKTGEKFLQHLATSEVGDLAFIVGYFDIPPSLVFTMSEGRDGMVAAVKGTLLSEVPINLRGHAGLDVTVTATAQGIDFVVRAKMYRANQRVYIVQAVFPKSVSAGEMAEKSASFFNGFDIREPPSDRP
jgi:hypothetical protein